MKLILIRHSFRLKWITGMSVIVLFTSFLISYFSYRAHYSFFEDEYGKQFSNSNKQAMARLEYKLLDLVKMSNLVMFNPQVERLFLQLSDPGTSELDTYLYHNELAKMLKQFQYDTPELKSLYLLDNNNITRYFGHFHETLWKVDDRNLYELKKQLTQSDKDMIWSLVKLPTVLDTDPKSESILITRWLYNSYMEKYGMMVIMVESSFFYRLFDQIIEDSPFQVYVLDNRSQLVYTNEPDPDRKGSLPQKDIHGTELLNIDGVPYLYTSHFSRNTGFTLISRTSFLHVQKKYQIIQNNSLYFSGLGIFLSMLLIFLYSKQLLSPLRRLLLAMSLFRTGDFAARIDLKGKDEFRVIGDSFNKMADDVQSLIQEVYIRQIHEREAELKAYQAQLNPHFLHNTLNGLYWKLYLENSPDNAELVSTLSDLLKYSLEPIEKPTTLGEELEQIHHYIDLHRAFLMEDLDTVYQIEDEVLQCRVIRLLLQPLVENVFIHAFKTAGSTKVLIIRAFRKEGQLQIEIIDNGIGMDGEILDKLNNGLDIENKLTELDTRSREHIGIRSVVRRVDILYGEPYGVRFFSEAGHGTTVRIVLPDQI